METKALVAGLIITLGVFAVKAGVGFGYLAAGQHGLKRASVAVVGYALLMGLVFWLAAWLMGSGLLDLATDLVKVLATQGMYVHFAMGAGLLAWGVFILTRPEGTQDACRMPTEKCATPASQPGSKAWLLLSAPCPMCLTVIFLDVGLLSGLFPEDPWRALVHPYLAFISLTLAATWATILFSRRAGTRPDHMIGWAMILCASFFAMNVVVLPHFQEAKTLYNLSLHQEALGGPSEPGPVAKTFCFSILAASFLAGVLKEARDIRRMRA